MPKHARKQPGHVPAEPAHVIVRVYDDRPELGNAMRHVATFANVPADWTNAHILKSFGIAEHLHVVRSGEGPDSIIQHGRR